MTHLYMILQLITMAGIFSIRPRDFERYDLFPPSDGC